METIIKVAGMLGFLIAVFWFIYFLAEMDRSDYKQKEIYFEECVEKTNDYKWCNKKINNPYWKLEDK